MPDTLHYCATLSAEAEEPLYGSAPYKTRWLALEYPHTWGAQAFAESDLAPAVKAHLSDYLDNTPLTNLLFIRQPGRRSDHLAFYMADIGDSAFQLYKWPLGRYEDLLEIDLNRLDEARRSEESLYLVCGNARRDACCATYGLPVFRAMRDLVGNQAWQSTHLGGHRFAATGLFLPSGVNYGRLRPEHVPHLVEQHHAGNIVLDKLRGRVCYDKLVQAGEYLLRQEIGATAILDVTLDSVGMSEANLWDITFKISGHENKIRLERLQTDVEIYTSCFNDKQSFVENYRLIVNAQT